MFTIPAENTTERSVKLALPKVTAHKMFVMVFSGDELKIKGYAIISVAGSNQKKDFRVTYQRENQGISYDEDASAKAANQDEKEVVGLTFYTVVVIEIILLVALLRNHNLIATFGKLTRKGNASLDTNDGRPKRK